MKIQVLIDGSVMLNGMPLNPFGDSPDYKLEEDTLTIHFRLKQGDAMRVLLGGKEHHLFVRENLPADTPFSITEGLE